MFSSCKEIMYEYALLKNPIYQHKVSIAIIVAILFMGICQYHSFIKNSYMNQLILPLLTFLFTYSAIDIYARDSVDNELIATLIEKCEMWQKDPIVRQNATVVDDNGDPLVNPVEVENYNSETFRENFANFKNHIETMNEPKMTPKDQEDFLDISRASNFSNADDSKNEYFKSCAGGKHYCIQPAVDNQMNDSDHMGTFNVDKANGVVRSAWETKQQDPANNDATYGTPKCSTLVAGKQNNCNVVAPIPGPQWMPERSMHTQARLARGDYMKNRYNVDKYNHYTRHLSKI